MAAFHLKLIYFYIGWIIIETDVFKKKNTLKINFANVHLYCVAEENKSV